MPRFIVVRVTEEVTIVDAADPEEADRKAYYERHQWITNADRAIESIDEYTADHELAGVVQSIL